MATSPPSRSPRTAFSWAQGGAGATGINAYAKYDATVVNTGNITAIADAEFGNTGAYGVIAHGKYSSHIVNEAGASIVASASVGSLARRPVRRARRLIRHPDLRVAAWITP